MDSTCSSSIRKIVQMNARKADMGMIPPSPVASFRAKLKDKKVQTTLTQLHDDDFVKKPS